MQGAESEHHRKLPESCFFSTLLGHRNPVKTTKILSL